MDQPGWLVRKVRGKAEVAVPRRFLMLGLTVLNSDQFNVLFAVTCQWRFSDSPVSFRLSPSEAGRLRDLSFGEAHQILNRLAQIGYPEVLLASNPDGRLVTIPRSQFCK